MWLSFIVLSTLIICLCTLNYAHNWGGDFSVYIMQARSISQFSTGEFIENNRVTIEQSSTRIGPVAYPWGFPVMLAPNLCYFRVTFICFKNNRDFILFGVFSGYMVRVWALSLPSLAVSLCLIFCSKSNINWVCKPYLVWHPIFMRFDLSRMPHRSNYCGTAGVLVTGERQSIVGNYYCLCFLYPD